MIKVYALLPKRADISEALFHEHWATVHRDHVLKIARLRRYVQSHCAGQAVPGLALAPYDGIPEVWYDSLASALGQDDDPASEGARLDMANFIDTAEMAWLMTSEALVRDTIDLDATPEATKLLILARRLSGTSPHSFATGWRDACDAALDALSQVGRAAVATTLAETYDSAEPAYDGVFELWWPDPDTFAREWEQAGRAALDELGGLAELERSHARVVREFRVIWPGPERAPDLTPKETA